MTTVLVTGASGFLGRAVARRLRAAGIRVVSLGRDGGGGAADEHHRLAWPLAPAPAAALLAAVAPDAVLHLAAPPPAAPDDVHAAITRDSALALLAAAGAAAPRARFVAIGSAAEHGAATRGDRPLAEDDPCEPVSSYARAKHAVTEAIARTAAAGGDATAVRLFGAAGPGMPEHMLFGRIARALARRATAGADRPIRVGPLSAGRDYLDVDEAARLIIAIALRAERPPPLLNVASGRAVAVRVIVDAMLALAGSGRRLIEDRDAMPGGPASVAGSTRRLEACGLTPAVATPAALAARILAPETTS